METISGAYSNPEQLQSLVFNKNVSTEEKLKEVGVQFESIMLREYLKTALRPMFEGHMGGSHAPAGNHFYEGMMVDKMADSLSRTGQIGLSKMFTDELGGYVFDDARAALKEKDAADSQREAAPMVENLHQMRAQNTQNR